MACYDESPERRSEVENAASSNGVPMIKKKANNLCGGCMEGKLTVMRFSSQYKIGTSMYWRFCSWM